ncbi:MAG: iron ABC transporter permease [Calditrichaeota bacterium]|nr:MAG: iron ABC transporter permease [Calditrichota bacterium]
MRTAISSAAILVFMISMASFSAPFLFGGDYRVLTVEIYNSKLQGDMPMAMTQSVMLGAISLLFLFVNIHTERSASGTGQKGVPLPPRPIQNTFYRKIAIVLAVLCSIILASPHLTLLLLSFTQNGSWTNQIIPESFTMANYGALFLNQKVSEPIVNSSTMAILATTANFIVAVGAAFWITQRRWRAGKLAEMMIMIPWAIPGTVIAIALIVVFNSGHWFTAGAVLVGSFWILPLAYFIRHLPIVYRAAHAAFSRFDRFQEEAALSLGGSSWLTFRKVIFPAVRPGVMAGVLLAMVMSLGEFVSSILLYTFTNRPISMAILNEMRLLNLGTAAAYGIMLTVIIFMITWLANRWSE